MRIEDVMTRNPEFVRPNATLREVADKMARNDVGVIPVSDGQRLFGVVTDRDLVVRGMARALDPATTTVEQCVTKNVTTCHPDDDLKKALQLMKERQIRRIPVVNRHNDLVGIVSLADVARHATDEAGDVLTKVSMPA